MDACSETFGPLAQIAIILMLEISWSVGKPHNALQGHVLNTAHLLILIGLLRQSYQESYLNENRNAAVKKQVTNVEK